MAWIKGVPHTLETRQRISTAQKALLQSPEARARRVSSLAGKAVTHGESVSGRRSPEYVAYKRIRSVCLNPRHPKFDRYGGRGITVGFTDFADFLACVGRRPSPKHSLDRINNDGNYEWGNLRWATVLEQAKNRGKRRFNRKDYKALEGKYDLALLRITELETLLAG